MDINDQSTLENYDRWHDHADTIPHEGYVPRRAVLISEILGDTDGPHPDE